MLSASRAIVPTSSAWLRAATKYWRIEAGSGCADTPSEERPNATNARTGKTNNCGFIRSPHKRGWVVVICVAVEAVSMVPLLWCAESLPLLSRRCRHCQVTRRWEFLGFLLNDLNAERALWCDQQTS